MLLQHPLGLWGALTCLAVRGSKDTRQQRERHIRHADNKGRFLKGFHLNKKSVYTTWHRSVPKSELMNTSTVITCVKGQASTCSWANRQRCVCYWNPLVCSLCATELRGWHSPKMLPRYCDKCSFLWWACKAALQIQSYRTTEPAACRSWWAGRSGGQCHAPALEFNVLMTTISVFPGVPKVMWIKMIP